MDCFLSIQHIDFMSERGRPQAMSITKARIESRDRVPAK